MKEINLPIIERVQYGLINCFQVRHHLRRLKYLLLALFNGELPRRKISELCPKFVPSMVSNNLNFTKLVCIGSINDKLAKSHFKELKKFIEMNSDWRFCFLDNQGQDSWMRSNFSNEKILDVYNNTIFGASKNDIFRYCFVNEYGCAYFALNMSMRKPISSVIGEIQNETLILSPAILSYKPQEVTGDFLEKFEGKSFVMAVVISTKNHPLLTLVLSEICQRYEIVRGQRYTQVDRAIWWYTGPFLFADAVIEYVLTNREKSAQDLGLRFLPLLFNHTLFRPYSARYRYISGASYIGFRNKEIAV
jgi:hypothetical protein